MGRWRRVHISAHALRRFRERWPECAHMPAHFIGGQVAAQVERTGREFVVTPGGDYYPISFLGRDGYAVLRAGQVTTILPEEWCPEVNAVRVRNRSAG